MEATGQNFVFDHDLLRTTELYHNWGTSMFDNDSMMTVEESNDPVSTAVAEERDITLDDFVVELEQLLLEEQRPSPTMSEPGFEVGDSSSEVRGGRVSAEEGAIEVGARPVLPAAESIGVTYHRKNKQWEAHLWLKDQQLRKRKKKGAQIFLGNFPTADEAKQAHDRAAIKLDVRETARGKAYPLNFPEAEHARYMAEHSEWSARDFLWKLRRLSPTFNKGKSRMKGVSVRRGRKRGGNALSVLYEAKISQTVGDGEKTTFDLGKFASEEEAGKAYDRALLFLKGVDELNCITNFRPSGYSAAEVQEAGCSLQT